MNNKQFILEIYHQYCDKCILRGGLNGDRIVLTRDDSENYFLRVELTVERLLTRPWFANWVIYSDAGRAKLTRRDVAMLVGRSCLFISKKAEPIRATFQWKADIFNPTIFLRIPLNKTELTSLARLWFVENLPMPYINY